MIATRIILNRQLNEGCPFCLENNLIPEEKILKKAGWAALVVEYSQVVPGTLQVIPRWHRMNNPLKWFLFLWSFFWLTWKTGVGPCNITINMGEDAGQTLPHPHVWIVPRYKIYAGKGLAYFVSLEAKSRTKLEKDLGELVTSQLPAND